MLQLHHLWYRWDNPDNRNWFWNVTSLVCFFFYFFFLESHYIHFYWHLFSLFSLRFLVLCQAIHVQFQINTTAEIASSKKIARNMWNCTRAPSPEKISISFRVFSATTETIAMRQLFVVRKPAKHTSQYQIAFVCNQQKENKFFVFQFSLFLLRWKLLKSY